MLKPAVKTGIPWVGDFTFTTTVRHTGVIVGGTGVLDGASEVRLRYRLPR